MKAEKFVRIYGGKPRNIYPPDQIEKIVEELESENIAFSEALIKYEISHFTLKRWIKTYGKLGSFPSAFKRISALEKRQILNEIDTGKLSVVEALKRYKVNEITLYYWRKQYSNEIACKKKTGNMENQEKTEGQRKEDRQIEDLKLKIAALETMIDVAEREFNIPIRKKHGSKQ